MIPRIAIVVVLAATLSMTLTASAGSPHDVMQAMYDRETAMVGGEVMLHVERLSPSSPPNTMDTEQMEIGNGVDLHVQWQSPYIFRIDIVQNGQDRAQRYFSGQISCGGYLPVELKSV